MLHRDLNKVYDYTLKQSTYIPTYEEFRLVFDAKVNKSFWRREGDYGRYKIRLKERHYFGQNRRCAYCRSKLRTDAYWEDLDHIVPQSEKENWIFRPKNLIVTCIPCNRLKNNASTLTKPLIKYFPLYSNAFTIFNPHFDKWSDHFQIDNGLFLVGKPGTKGPFTYQHCHLYRHDIIISYADEIRLWSIFTLRRLTHKLKDVIKGSKEEDSLQKAILHMIERKKNR